MTVTSGFYNSLNGDRKYSSEQFGAMFNGLIKDGIFASVGAAFAVSVNTGVNMGVKVGTGRAWLNGSWINNDALYPLVLDDSEVVLKRIDSIILDIDASDGVRANTIKILKGIPAVSPSAPELITDNNSDHYQYSLCNIKVMPGVTTIATKYITDTRGKKACPFVTGILQTIAIDSIVAQWEAEFYDWFNSLELTLSGDISGQIESLINVGNYLVIAEASSTVNKGVYPLVNLFSNSVVELKFINGNTAIDPHISIGGTDYLLKYIPKIPKIPGSAFQKYRFIKGTEEGVLTYVDDGDTVCESGSYFNGAYHTCKYKRFSDGTIETRSYVKKGSDFTFISAGGGLYKASNPLTVSFPSGMFSSEPECDSITYTSGGSIGFAIHYDPELSGTHYNMEVSIGKSSKDAHDYGFNILMSGRWYPEDAL